jgi:Lrp/AsnC family transcriptional regulator for asnA, asnC and gidA
MRRWFNNLASYGEEVAEAISELPEVSFVAFFTGDFDVMEEITCRDVEHMTELLIQRINQISGVEKTRFSLHLRRVKLKQPSVSLLKSNDLK